MIPGAPISLTGAPGMPPALYSAIQSARAPPALYNAMQSAGAPHSAALQPIPILGTGTLKSSRASSQVASQRSLTPRPPPPPPPGIKATSAVITKTVKPLPASPQDGRGGGEAIVKSP